MTPDSEHKEFGHWAKHGGPMTWCGVPVSSIKLISRGELTSTTPHRSCVEAFNKSRTDRAQAVRKALAEADITPEYLNSREPSTKTPEITTPS